MARYGMVIDLNACMGCRACMVACKIENGTPASHFFMYVFRFEEGNYPNAQIRFLPRPCMHCSNPPCVEACPFDARIQWRDGLVETDYDNCHGARLCEQACPYGVNYFNIDDPAKNQYFDYDDPDIQEVLQGIIPAYWNPDTAKPSTWEGDEKKPERRLAGGGHRKNTVNKCTFCLHRLDQGITVTACQQVCPVRAIHFGDLDDPNSEVSRLLRERSNEVFRLKEDAGTDPKVFYLGMPPERDARVVETAPVKPNVQILADPEKDDGVIPPWK